MKTKNTKIILMTVGAVVAVTALILIFFTAASFKQKDDSKSEDTYTLEELIKDKGTVEIPKQEELTDTTKSEVPVENSITEEDIAKAEDYIANLTPEQLEEYRGEGAKFIVSENINPTVTDYSGSILAESPMDDPLIKEDWRSAETLLINVIREPFDVDQAYTSDIYVDTELIDQGIMQFAERYIQRSVKQAEQEYGKKYGYEFRVLEPSEQTENFPVIEGRSVVRVRTFQE